jgi:hypothetical protein
MKPTSTFKMSKQTKRYLAMLPFANNEQRAAFKRGSIQAQLAAEHASRAKLDKSAREE